MPQQIPVYPRFPARVFREHQWNWRATFTDPADNSHTSRCATCGMERHWADHTPKNGGSSVQRRYVKFPDGRKFYWNGTTKTLPVCDPKGITLPPLPGDGG